MKTYSLDGIEHCFDCQVFKDRIRHWGAGGLDKNKRTFAETLGVSKDTIDGWARGSHSPKDYESVEAVASALGVEPESLLSPITSENQIAKELNMAEMSTTQRESANRVFQAFQKYYSIADESNGFIFDKYPLACLPFGLSDGLVPDRFYYNNSELDPDTISGHLLKDQSENQLRRSLEAEYLQLDRDLFWALLEHVDAGVDAIPISYLREKGKFSVESELSKEDELWFTTMLGIKESKANMYRIFDEYLGNDTSYGNYLAVLL